MKSETPWLKKRIPEKGPPVPDHVDRDALLVVLGQQQGMGISSPAADYLYAHTPPVVPDDWGDPLPLSPYEQDGLDRLVAIMASPLERGWALIVSGELIDDEVGAIIAGFPDVYAILTTRVRNDMLTHPHPYPQWSESVIGVLFGKPAPLVISPPPGQDQGAPEDKKLPTPPATQADRRELAVRDERT